MNTRNRQLGDMLPCELIQYGREAHSVVAWETVALELERRLVTRRRPDVNDGLDANDWNAAHREHSHDYFRADAALDAFAARRQLYNGRFYIWNTAPRATTRDGGYAYRNYQPLGLLGETWRLPTRDSEDMATGIR